MMPSGASLVVEAEGLVKRFGATRAVGGWI
jgi:hypothetical protein